MQTEGHDDIPTCPQPINWSPHITWEVMSVAGLPGTELKQSHCLIAVRGVSVLSAANVDLLTLNPALTSHGVYLTEEKKHTAAQHGQFG